MTTQSKSLRLATDLAEYPYTWPGGYPRFAVADDGQAICPKCCRDERESIATTSGKDGWCVVALDINWEDPELLCSACCQPIEAAYL